jgi:hypothetical protein
MEFVENPKAKIAAEIYRRLANRFGAFAACNWMFLAHEEFGGASAIEAIRQGRDEQVRIVAESALICKKP